MNIMVDQLDYELKTNQLQGGKFFIELYQINL